MEYRQLGHTNIDVSLMTLGTMTYGEQNTLAEAFEQMDCAFAHGVNTIDVAEMYPVPPRESTYGQSEVIVGRWLKDRGLRDKIVLATKVTGNGSNNNGFEHIRGGPRLSAQQIKQAVDDSLQRLQTDYIDLYQLHWPERKTNFFGRLGYQHEGLIVDGNVEDGVDDSVENRVENSAKNSAGNDDIPLEESLLVLSDLIDAGKIRHYGLSNETPWGVMESCRVAAEHNIPRPVSVQNPYNLLNRSYEIGLAEISQQENIGLLAYSPLAFGMLSGKYYQGARPENSRLTRYSRFSRYTNPQAEAAADAYVELARNHQLDPSEMALAFVNSRRFVTANIIGATSVEQLMTNMRSMQLVLSDEQYDGIDAIHRQYCNPAP